MSNATHGSAEFAPMGPLVRSTVAVIHAGEGRFKTLVALDIALLIASEALTFAKVAAGEGRADEYDHF